MPLIGTEKSVGVMIAALRHHACAWLLAISWLLGLWIIGCALGIGPSAGFSGCC